MIRRPVAAALVLLPLVTACGGGSPGPARTLDAFIAAWNHDDGKAMAALVDRPPAGFASAVIQMTAGLGATSAVHRAATPVVRGATATSTVTSTYQLPQVGPWTVTTTLHLGRHGNGWSVGWAPGAVAPGLLQGQRLVASYEWAPRAQILGKGGAPLTTESPRVTVGVEGSRVKNRPQLTQVLESAGATAGEVNAALASAAAHPTFFEPVFQLTEAAFTAMGGDTSALYTVAGTVFRRTTQRTAITAGLSAHLVGAVGPVTADELKELGPPYSAASVVGQSGIESAYDKQLSGSPGATIQIVGSGDGSVARTLATLAPHAGTPVDTGIEPAVQQAAEAALASVKQPAALVAVSASTGEVLASVSDPPSEQFDQALDGEYPPGSTFKVLTSTALFEAGLSPSSPASCPPTVTIDGETFHNAGGERPVSTVSGAFTESCNTAFVQLATAHLQASSFPAVAALFAIGDPIRMGLPAFAGKVPAPTDRADLAASSIGQASVVVSPLDMAMVAAAVDSGTVRPPRLVSGSPDDAAQGHPLPAAIVSELRTMMSSVVTGGTAAGTGLPAGTFAKTGTAEYGSGKPLPVDAWLAGYRGDVAFAMVVHNAPGDGGPVDGPVVARFLDALPHGTS